MLLKMLVKVLFVCLFGLVLSDKVCYWNAPCLAHMYSTRTPYDSVRGDIRDYAGPQNCEAISIWSLHRHGNRNPGGADTEAMKNIVTLKDEIISSFEAGKSQLCSQDIEDFRKWTWNETIEVSHSFLTGTGYEELFNIGKRIRERYPHLLSVNGSYYFRPTSEQRTITSSIAFVHGLTDGTNLTLPIDDVRERDDIIRIWHKNYVSKRGSMASLLKGESVMSSLKLEDSSLVTYSYLYQLACVDEPVSNKETQKLEPYENCERYQVEVKGGQALVDEMNNYYNSEEFQAVRTAVQHRLGIPTQLSSKAVYDIYNICRFYRSWTANLKSPWCAAFTDEDLEVLEYSDDVRHYYRNGYGSRVNAKLGGLTLKDLYENFEAVVQNNGSNIVSYFTHDTMLDMVFCAMGVFKDNSPIRGERRDKNRLWRTSFLASFAVNFIAVLNSCQESGTQTYRVQLFINEKETELCPLEGCTWQQFQEKFQPFTSSNLDFCSTEYVMDMDVSNSSGVILFNSILLVMQVLILYLKIS